MTVKFKFITKSTDLGADIFVRGAPDHQKRLQIPQKIPKTFRNMLKTQKIKIKKSMENGQTENPDPKINRLGKILPRRKNYFRTMIFRDQKCYIF